MNSPCTPETCECPRCGELVVHERKSVMDDWPGGWVCECGWKELDKEYDDERI